MRSTSLPSSQIDVATSTGSSARVSDTFRPIPTTAAGPALVSTRSTSSPAVLRVPSRTSFGHFSAAVGEPVSRRALATATPVSSGSQGQAAASTSGRSSTEKVSAERAGVIQVRSRRPRPAVWCSATTTRPSAAPARARSATRALVEGAASTTSTSYDGAVDVRREAANSLDVERRALGRPSFHEV